MWGRLLLVLVARAQGGDLPDDQREAGAAS